MARRDTPGLSPKRSPSVASWELAGSRTVVCVGTVTVVAKSVVVVVVVVVAK